MTSSNPVGTLYRCSKCISRAFSRQEAEEHVRDKPDHKMTPLLEVREERKR